MPKSSEIEGLLSRLEAATEGSDDMDREVAIALGWTPPAMGLPFWHDDDANHWTALPDWSTSIDAALALVERLLPGWGATVVTDPPSCCLRISTSDSMAHFKATGFFLDEFPIYEASTPPVAILLALFRALSARPRP